MPKATTPSAPELAHALLATQFYPSTKRHESSLPPTFSSTSFTFDIAKKLAACEPRITTYVRARSRRFDGLIRHMGIPHPVSHSALVQHLHDHWSQISPMIDGPHSEIRPERPKGDGKIVVFDYDSPVSKKLREVQLSQAKSYRVDADISNFFPSLYTHVIDWALRGKKAAKADKNKGWQHKLDRLIQNCHDGETRGVMIGPAVGNVVSEIVMQRVDAGLEKARYKHFQRHIDDYTAFFATRKEAESFIHDLDRELAEYRLQLNTRKTKIVSLRYGAGEPWLSTLTAHLPRKRTGLEISRYLEECEELAEKNKGSSVITFAVKSLFGRCDVPPLGRPGAKPANRKTHLPLLHETLRLTYFHPHLAPHLARILYHCKPLLNSSEEDRIARHLRVLLSESCNRGETDTTAWYIYCLRSILGEKIGKSLIHKILSMQDDVTALSVARHTKKGMQGALAWVKGMDLKDDFELQSHWLIRYELYRLGHLKSNDLSPREKSWFTYARPIGLAFTTP